MNKKFYVKNKLLFLLFLVFVFSISFLLYQIFGSSRNNVNNINNEQNEKKDLGIKSNLYNNRQDQQVFSSIYGKYSIKFSDDDFNLSYVEAINNGLAMYYLPEGKNANSKSKLIINQYGNNVTAEELSGGIIKESNENGDELFSPFTAPDSKGRESYYIASKASRYYDEENATIYVMKIFEDSGSTYSIIFSQEINGEDKADVQNISETWILDNLIKINGAIEKIDLTIPTSFYKKTGNYLMIYQNQINIHL